MKPNTIDKSQFEEAKAQYADTVERKKTYIRNNSVYIENKRKRIGLNESDYF